MWEAHLYQCAGVWILYYFTALREGVTLTFSKSTATTTTISTTVWYSIFSVILCTRNWQPVKIWSKITLRCEKWFGCWGPVAHNVLKLSTLVRFQIYRFSIVFFLCRFFSFLRSRIPESFIDFFSFLVFFFRLQGVTADPSRYYELLRNTDSSIFSSNSRLGWARRTCKKVFIVFLLGQNPMQKTLKSWTKKSYPLLFLLEGW